MYLLFLAGPGHLHEIAASVFSRSPLGRANTFSFLFLGSIPRLSLKRFSYFTLFLKRYEAFPLFLSFLSFLLLLSCASQTSRTDMVSSRFPPLYHHTFSSTLSHLIPARLFVTFSHTALSTIMVGNLFFGFFPYFTLPFQLSHVYICLEWAHSQFCF